MSVSVFLFYVDMNVLVHDCLCESWYVCFLCLTYVCEPISISHWLLVCMPPFCLTIFHR